VGRAVGLGDGIKVGITGTAVGLGEGIKDGLMVGSLVVGNFVGLGVGMVEGIVVGDGEGMAEGLAVGIRVLGERVGGKVGDNVGPHVVQVRSIQYSDPLEAPIEITSQEDISRGGVFNHFPVAGACVAKTPSPEITQKSLSSQYISLLSCASQW